MQRSGDELEEKLRHLLSSACLSKNWILVKAFIKDMKDTKICQPSPHTAHQSSDPSQQELV